MFENLASANQFLTDGTFIYWHQSVT